MQGERTGIRSVTILAVAVTLQFGLMMLYLPFQFQVGTLWPIFPYLAQFGTAYFLAAVLLLLDCAQVGLPRWTGWAGRILTIVTILLQAMLISYQPRVVTGMVLSTTAVLVMAVGWIFPHLERRAFQVGMAAVAVSFGGLPGWLGPMFLITGLIQPLAWVAARQRPAVEWWAMLLAAAPFGWFASLWLLQGNWVGVIVYQAVLAAMVVSALYVRRPWTVRVPSLRRRVMALALTVAVVPLVVMGGWAVHSAEDLEQADQREILRHQIIRMEAAMDFWLTSNPGEPFPATEISPQFRRALAERRAEVEVLPLSGFAEPVPAERVTFTVDLDERGIPLVKATLRRPDLGVVLTMTEPVLHVSRRASQLAVGALTLTGLIATLALAFSLALSIRITRHLQLVRDMAGERARRIDAQFHVASGGDDEVADLSQTVSWMADTLEKSGEELRRLMTVTDTALAHLSLKELLKELLRRVRDILEADTAAILLPTADGRRLTVAAALGDEESRPVASHLGAQLLVEDRVVGVVNVGYYDPHHSSPGDARLLQLVADRIAVAIDHARLFEQQVEARRQVEAQQAEVQLLNQTLERRVADRTAELSAANKELESFAFSVSHDLRGPLRSVTGFSEALAEDYGGALPVEGREYLQRIRQGVDRMSALIDALLRLSRVTRADLTRAQVSITRLAWQVVDELQRHEPLRRVTVRIQGDLTAEADERLLRIVLDNLLGNAWKFTARQADPVIEVGARPEDGVTAFYVRDNGAGFDMTYVDKLFVPFQRLHGATDYEGNGIGLALVYRIVTRHGGRIWAEGEVGRGATFSFTLEAHPQVRPVTGGAATDGGR